MKLARIDQNQSIMMEEIKQLGRRTEPSHARIHFEKIDTIDAFIEFDAKLKDDREFRNLTVWFIFCADYSDLPCSGHVKVFFVF